MFGFLEHFWPILLVAAAVFVQVYRHRTLPTLQKFREMKKLSGTDHVVETGMITGHPYRVTTWSEKKADLELEVPGLPLEFYRKSSVWDSSREGSLKTGDSDFDAIVSVDGEAGLALVCLGASQRSLLKAFVKNGGRLGGGRMTIETSQLRMIQPLLYQMTDIANRLSAPLPDAPKDLLIWLQDEDSPHRVAALRSLQRHWPSMISVPLWLKLLSSPSAELAQEAARLAVPEIGEHLRTGPASAWIMLAMFGKPELQHAAMALLRGHPASPTHLQLAMSLEPMPALLEVGLQTIAPGPELELFLVTALNASPTNPDWKVILQESALQVLKERGSVRVVEALLPLVKRPAPFGEQVADVIRAIQGRVGADRGLLSLSESEGGLTTAQQGGEVSAAKMGE